MRGVSSFATYFAMPGIICVSIADADLENLRWELLTSLVIGKAVIFALVALTSSLIVRPKNLGVAGILAIFCVQCNDLPVGNPLMSALYRNLRPHMMKYLFFIPALTILFFTPFSYFMMERQKQKRPKPMIKWNYTGFADEKVKENLECMNNSENTKRIMRNIINNILKSPVIIATLIGIALNLTFKAQVPHVLHHPINVLAATIPGLALSILGFSMMGKERYLLRFSIVLALVLVAVKMILTPLILHSIVKALTLNSEYLKELSDFVLLYGIISPAATVFQSGEEYRLPLTAMGAALILSSFICFPLSFVIAKFSIVNNMTLNLYVPLLQNIAFYISMLSIISIISLWLIFALTKQWKKIQCMYVSYFTFAQLMICCGTIIKLFDKEDRDPWSIYSQVILFNGGEISAYIWATLLTAILAFQQNNSVSIGKNFRIFLIICTGLSVLLTIVMCLLLSKEDVSHPLMFGEPKTSFHFLQLEVTSAILIFYLTCGGICLVLHLRRKNIKHLQHYQNICRSMNELPYERNEKLFEKNIYVINCCIHENESNVEKLRSLESSTSISKSTSKLFQDDDEICNYYHEMLKSSFHETNSVFDHEWTCRLFALLALTWLTMAIKFMSNIYKLMGVKESAIIIPLEFLQSLLFLSQGLLVFLIFGIDIRTVTMSLIKWLRKIRHGNENFISQVSSFEKEEIAVVCEQFVSYYYWHCHNDLAKERRWKSRHYKDSFWGHQLVDWLITAGLSKDSLEAEIYGQKLLYGGLIQHIRNAHNFHDEPYLYFFVKKEILMQNYL